MCVCVCVCVCVCGCVCVCPSLESKDMKSKYSMLQNLCPEQAEYFNTRVDITRSLKFQAKINLTYI
jgi:hypothetical protein